MTKETSLNRTFYGIETLLLVLSNAMTLVLIVPFMELKLHLGQSTNEDMLS